MQMEERSLSTSPSTQQWVTWPANTQAAALCAYPAHATPFSFALSSECE